MERIYLKTLERSNLIQEKETNNDESVTKVTTEDGTAISAYGPLFKEPPFIPRYAPFIESTYKTTTHNLEPDDSDFYHKEAIETHESKVAFTSPFHEISTTDSSQADVFCPTIETVSPFKQADFFPHSTLEITPALNLQDMFAYLNDEAMISAINKENINYSPTESTEFTAFVSEPSDINDLSNPFGSSNTQLTEKTQTEKKAVFTPCAEVTMTLDNYHLNHAPRVDDTSTSGSRKAGLTDKPSEATISSTKHADLLIPTDGTSSSTDQAEFAYPMDR